MTSAVPVQATQAVDVLVVVVPRAHWGELDPPSPRVAACLRRAADDYAAQSNEHITRLAGPVVRRELRTERWRFTADPDELETYELDTAAVAAIHDATERLHRAALILRELGGAVLVAVGELVYDVDVIPVRNN